MSTVPLFVLIFLEGFVSIAIEILTIRQLMPFIGTSVVVTSLIIGVFLLFLALGYWQGGRKRKNFQRILERNFICSALFIGIGLSYLFTACFFYLAYTFISSNFFITLNCYLLLIIAPLVYLLGQTIPITMNLYKKEEAVGAIGGKILFLSTLGSFLGAILTTLIFIQFLGVAATLSINAVILLVIIFLFPNPIKSKTLAIIILIPIAWIIYVINVKFETAYFTKTDNYANYQVIKNYNIANNNHGTLLKINETLASFIGDNKQSFPYIELIKKILFQDLNLQHKHILVLGAGGFTLSAETTNNNDFTYIDIDPHIKSIVQNNFLKHINGTFIAKDARVYLNETNKIFDVIVSDTYSNVNAIPEELVTFEYFQKIKLHLANNGIAIFNIIAKPFFNDPYSKRIDTTLRAVFDNCIAIPEKYNENFTNIIYVCRKNVKSNSKAIYTDNLNSATLDFFTETLK
jgi:spermidine synthase